MMMSVMRAVSDAVAVEVGVVSGLEKSRCQSFVVGERCPSKTGWCWYVIVTVSAVKVAVQPWSQSWPIEISEPEASVGKMCAWQAAVGRNGKSMVAV